MVCIAYVVLFKCLGKAKCQMTHNVFFWLLLKDIINARDILQRRGMKLGTRLSDFAKACWNSIGVRFVSTRPLVQIFIRIKRGYTLRWSLDIIILMAWFSITWTPLSRTARESFARNSNPFFIESIKAEEAMEAWLDSVHF